MIDLKAFRKANNLTQTELGDYLGIKKSFVSAIETGKAGLPEDKFTKLMDNSQGWDTSMLIAESDIHGDVSMQAYGQNNVGKMVADAELSTLRRENEMLRTQVEELKAEKEKYWDMIQRLTAR